MQASQQLALVVPSSSASHQPAIDTQASWLRKPVRVARVGLSWWEAGSYQRLSSACHLSRASRPRSLVAPMNMQVVSHESRAGRYAEDETTPRYGGGGGGGGTAAAGLKGERKVLDGH